MPFFCNGFPILTFVIFLNMTDSLIITPESWTKQLKLEGLFDQEKPLEVDVGCGKGRFLIARAKAFQEINFLGIDRQIGRLRKIEKKAKRAELTNVKLLRIEASYALEYLLPPKSVSTFYVFFPDPWPKRRHARRRLFQPEFLDILEKKLRPDGMIHAATDNLDYFKIIFDLLSNDPRFKQEETFEPSAEEKTDFELIFLKKNDPIGRCSFRISK
jgi:tRNA (guanine-N7-)-methyltransferase